jgi:hypothetical protein
MKPVAPPNLLERLLLFLLPEHDRETVSGDLYEEFLEVKLPQLGQFKARLWYLRQVFSFVPARVLAALSQRPTLSLLCCFTALAGGWLGVMELRLRHPGYAGREWISATIVAQALVTLSALCFHRYKSLRAVAMTGTLGVLWLGVTALRATLGGAHLEGYVLLIALALIVQAVLTLFTLPRAGAPRRKNA